MVDTGLVTYGGLAMFPATILTLHTVRGLTVINEDIALLFLSMPFIHYEYE